MNHCINLLIPDNLELALSFIQLKMILEFQVINHGITSLFRDKVREVTKQLFSLPMEQKQKYSRESDSIEGYGNDMIFSEQQTLDWNNRLYIIVGPKDKQKLKYWPENLEDLGNCSCDLSFWSETHNLLEYY